MAEQVKNDGTLRAFMHDEDTVKEYFLSCPFEVQHNTYFGQRMLMPKDRKTGELYFDGLRQLEKAYKNRKERGIYKDDMVASEFRSEFCRRMYWRLREDAQKAWQDMPKGFKGDWKGGRECETLWSMAQLMGNMYGAREKDDRFAGEEVNKTSKKYQQSYAEADYALSSRSLLYSDALVQLFSETYPKFKENALEVIQDMQVKKERQEIVDKVINLEDFFNANAQKNHYIEIVGGKSNSLFSSSVEKYKLEEEEHLKNMKSANVFSVPNFMKDDFCQQVSVELAEMAKKSNDYSRRFNWTGNSSENRYTMGKGNLESVSNYFKDSSNVNDKVINELYTSSPEFKKTADAVLLRLQHKEQDRISEVDKKTMESVSIGSVDKFEIGKIGVGRYTDNEIKILGMKNMKLNYHADDSENLSDKQLSLLYNSKEFMERFSAAISEKLGDEKVKSAISAIEKSEEVRRFNNFTDRDYDRENSILNAAMTGKQVSFDKDFDEVLRLKKELRSAMDLDKLVVQVRDDMVCENNAKRGRPEGLFTIDNFVVKDDKCIATVNFNFEETNGKSDKKEFVQGAKTEIELPANPGMALKLLSKMQENYENSRSEQNSVRNSYYGNCIDDNGKLVSFEPKVPTNCIEPVKREFNYMMDECKKVQKWEKEIEQIQENRKKRSSRYFGLGGTIDKMFHKDELMTEQRKLNGLAKNIEDSKSRAERSADRIKIEEPMLNRTKEQVESVMKKINYAKIDTNEVKKTVDLSYTKESNNKPKDKSRV